MGYAEHHEGVVTGYSVSLDRYIRRKRLARPHPRTQIMPEMIEAGVRESNRRSTWNGGGDITRLDRRRCGMFAWGSRRRKAIRVCERNGNCATTRNGEQLRALIRATPTIHASACSSCTIAGAVRTVESRASLVIPINANTLTHGTISVRSVAQYPFRDTFSKQMITIATRSYSRAVIYRRQTAELTAREHITACTADRGIGALRNNNQNLQRQVYRMQMEMLAHDECASSKDTRYCIIGTSAYDRVFCDTFDEAVKHAGPMMARQNAPSKLLVVKVEGVVERTTPPITSRPLRPGELSMKGKSKSGEL